jgi:hypothetical protein
MNPQPVEQNEPHKMTLAEAQALDLQMFENQADDERRRIAKKRGLFKAFNGAEHNPSVEELRVAVELDGDTIRYAKDAKGNERIARDKHGFLARPKRTGRRNPHRSKTAHAIKNAAVSVFRTLFLQRRDELQREAAANGTKFEGVPKEELVKIGAKSAVRGHRRAEKLARVKRDRARNQQTLSRHINAGILPGNTNRLAYQGGGRFRG